MKKLEFKGCLLTGRKAGITKNYTESITELVQIRINSDLRQQFIEYVLRFRNDKGRAREYRVGKDVFDTATEYLIDTAKTTAIV